MVPWQVLAGVWGGVAGVEGCRSPLLPVPALMSLPGQSPSSWESGGGVYPAGKLGENIYGGLLGEGKQKEGRRTVSQEGSWPGSCCEYKAGQM